MGSKRAGEKASYEFLRVPPAFCQLSRRFAEECLCRIDKGVDELAILHQLTNMAIKGGANFRKLGEMNLPPAGLDPVIGQARHTKDGGRGFLGEPQHAPPAP